MREIVSEYAPGEEEDFAEWAFGSDFLSLCGRLAFLDAWNKLHGDIFTLIPSGCPSQDIPKMIQIWRDNKDG